MTSCLRSVLTPKQLVEGRALVARSLQPQLGRLSNVNSAWERFVQQVPVVRGRHAILKFIDDLHAPISVGHDDDAVALVYVRDQPAVKTPVVAVMTEIPAFAVSPDEGAHCVGAHADRGNHFPRRHAAENATAGSAQCPLYFDGQSSEVGRGGPEACCCLLGVYV